MNKGKKYFRKYINNLGGILKLRKYIKRDIVIIMICVFVYILWDKKVN